MARTKNEVLTIRTTAEAKALPEFAAGARAAKSREMTENNA